jgi:nickel transport protein
VTPALRALLLLLALAGTARAHRLNVEGRVEAGRVRVEVYFSDGTTPEGAEVVAVREGVEVARGATDAAGRFSFAPPAAGRYAITVVEPGLHRGRVDVEVAPADLAPATSAATAATPTSSAADAGHPRAGSDDWAGTLAGLVAIGALALGLTWWQRRAGMRATT